MGSDNTSMNMSRSNNADFEGIINVVFTENKNIKSSYALSNIQNMFLCLPSELSFSCFITFMIIDVP